VIGALGAAVIGSWTTLACHVPGSAPVAVPANLPTVVVAEYSIPLTWSV
jgi:hypothetical protein